MSPRSLLSSFCLVFGGLAFLLTSCKPAVSAKPEPAPATPTARQTPQPVASPPSEPDSAVITPGRVSSGGPEEKRVVEIAEMLNPEPRGLGEPITNRAAWEAFPNREAILTTAERELKEPSPALPDDLYLSYLRTGSRKEYDPPYRERTKRLADFTLAECIENNGRFLPAIESELAAILGERTWTLPYHDRNLESFNGKPIVDLGASMRAWNLATVDFLLGDRLKSETRASLRKEVSRRVLDVYRQQVLGTFDGSREWWLRVDHNWNAVCHAGVIGSALALLPARDDRAWFLASMERYIPNYLSGFTPDGYCSEGIGYWNYGFGHYALMAEATGEATSWKLDLFAPEIVKNILLFPRRLEILPGVYPSFSDNSPSARPSRWITQLAGKRVSGISESGGPIVVSGLASHPLAAMLYETMALAFSGSSRPGEESSTLALPLRDSFPDAGIVVCRSAGETSSKGFGIAMKAGHNDEHHNHNDVGSYVVALNGKALLADPGMEVYTSRTFGPHRYDSKVLNSYGHPVPLVAGQLQDTGAEAKGTISTLQTSDAEDRFLLDLTAAYAKSVPSLKKLTRQMAYRRSSQPVMEISDEADFEAPQSFGTALITFGKMVKRSPDTLVIYDGKEAVQVGIDTGGAAYSIKEETLEENLPSGRKARRIGIQLDQPSMQAHITCRIQPTSAPITSNPVIDKAAGESRDPQYDRTIRKEAEDLESQTGGTVERAGKNAASGGTAIRMWNEAGHELTWKYRLPEAGTYGILLRYCSGGTEDVLRSLSVDGLPADGIQGGFSFPPTGGWSGERDDWKEVWLAQGGRVYLVSLDAGVHTLSLKNLEGGAITLDWIGLVPLKK